MIHSGMTCMTYFKHIFSIFLVTFGDFWRLLAVSSHISGSRAESASRAWGGDQGGPNCWETGRRWWRLSGRSSRGDATSTERQAPCRGMSAEKVAPSFGSSVFPKVLDFEPRLGPLVTDAVWCPGVGRCPWPAIFASLPFSLFHYLAIPGCWLAWTGADQCQHVPTIQIWSLDPYGLAGRGMMTQTHWKAFVRDSKRRHG